MPSLRTMSNLHSENGTPPAIGNAQGREIIRLITRLDDAKREIREREQAILAGVESKEFGGRQVAQLNTEFLPLVERTFEDILKVQGLLERMHRAIFDEVAAARTEAQRAWAGRVDSALVAIKLAALPIKIRQFHNLKEFKEFYVSGSPEERAAIQEIGGVLAHERWPDDPQIGSFIRLLKDDAGEGLNTPRMQAAQAALEEFYFVHPFTADALRRYQGGLSYSWQMDLKSRLEALKPPKREMDSATLRWI
jgi:hypothetical protein